MFPILPYLRKFQFSLSVSTSTNLKVKITIKINPYQKFDVICYSMYEIFVKVIFFTKSLLLLLGDPVEEAKLNNCSMDTFQTLHKIRFHDTQCTGV